MYRKNEQLIKKYATIIPMSQTHYGGAIWTNHALDRLEQRRLPQSLASEAFNHPDQSFPGKQAGTMEYQKRYGNSLITIIAKQNEKREWIILSTWIDPPLPGTLDFKKKEAWNNYKKASGWKKFWLTVLRQLGF